MDSKDVRRMLESVAATAQEAADEAKEKMQSAGQSLSEKYDAAKLNLLLTRLRGEQERVFADMGRTLFLMDTGNYSEEEGHPTAQQTIDRLLLAAEQKQQEIDRLLTRLAQVSDTRRCPACGRACGQDDRFCPECGARLEKSSD